MWAKSARARGTESSFTRQDYIGSEKSQKNLNRFIFVVHEIESVHVTRFVALASRPLINL